MTSKLGTITLPDGRSATLEMPNGGTLIWTSADKPLQSQLSESFGFIPDWGPADGHLGFYQLHQAAKQFGATISDLSPRDERQLIY